MSAVPVDPAAGCLSESEAVALHRALHAVGATHTPALRGGAIPSVAIERKSPSNLRFARLPAPFSLDVMEQNPNKSSKWSRLVSAGHCVSWFIRRVEAWALCVDDEVVRHGRCIIRSAPREAGDDGDDDDDDDPDGRRKLAAEAVRRAVEAEGDESETVELDDDDVRGMSAGSLPTAVASSATPTPTPTPPVTKPTSASPPLAVAAVKPLCKYGASCYRKNVGHLQAFAHPHLDALVEAQQKKHARPTDAAAASTNDNDAADDDGGGSTLPLGGAAALHDVKRARVDADGFAVPSLPVAASASASSAVRPLISLPQSVNEIDWAHIKLGAVIGKGAMGAVHRAQFTMPSGEVIDVAVKQLHQSADGELPQKEIDRFRSELILLSRLQHENIVKCYGGILSSSAASPLAIVMEFIAETLKRRITRTGGLVGTMTFAELVEICSGMARGIAFLHDQAIIHRDLKPGNCLLRGNVAKVCDFGISRSHEGTSAMTRIGTPTFMAPELLKGEPYGKSIDVYSFGMIAWQLSTGAHPFGKPGAGDGDGDAADAFNIIMKAAVKNERPEFAPGTPAPLVELIDACWHRVPAARPSAAELVAALEAMQQHTD